MSFPKYPIYKSSGVEWLGAVPSHWYVSPLKRHIEANDGGAWGEDPDGENDTMVLRSTEQTVDGRWAIDHPAFRKLAPAERAATLLNAGDLLVTKSSGSSLHIGKTTLVSVEIAAQQCCFSNFMQRLRLRHIFLPRLGWYWMNSPLVRVQFDALSNSTTGLANFSGGLIGQLLVALPPLAEQRVIVAFLDRETTEIDALIAEQERLIELLKEKRQSVISHAVTKGLNPNVPMKPSGVEWLGDVPAHWTVVPLKWLTDQNRPIMYGIVLPGPDVDFGVPILKGGNVKPARMNLESMARTTPELEAPYARARLRSGDLVYSIRGTIGDCEEVPAALEGSNITQDVARVAVHSDTHHLWVRWALLSAPVREDLACQSIGAAVRGVNIFDLKRARIPVPPMREQIEISSIVGQEVEQIDALMVSAQRSITLLRERRSALISAAVTGQIDVRGLVEQEAA